jgi:hypothetical protein
VASELPLLNDDLARFKYGALLPRTGVHFIPDEKVVRMLRIINLLEDFHGDMANYYKAQEMRELMEKYSLAEFNRVVYNM